MIGVCTLRYDTICSYGYSGWFNLDLDTGEIISDDEGEQIKLQGKPNLIEVFKIINIYLRRLTIK